MKCLWVEARAEVTVFRTVDSLSLTAGPNGTVLFEKRFPRETKATITVRISPESNWYYARVSQGNREGGPGWRRAPDNRRGGGVITALRWTDWDEESIVEWRKRITLTPEGELGEEGRSPWPEQLKKGWNGEGAAPGDD